MISEDGFFLPSVLPSSSSISDSGFAVEEINYPNPNPNPETPAGNNKRKRNLPRSPNPEVEVVAMSPKTLMTTNRFICEICNKGFQRDQNLQLHRRGHNLPWKLKQKANKEQVKKKVYICPEKSCVHHDPSRALGDLTGIKKHFSRKHGEKKWKCDKCSKKYAVMSDWKAHSKICGTREYKCDCGTIFSRKDSFITHRAFCDALTEERVRVNTNTIASSLIPNMGHEMIGFIAGDRSSEINIPSFSASQRPDFLGFESLASTNLGSKSRLPLWIDMNNHVNPSSSIGGSGSGHLLPEFSPSLFTSSSSFPQPLKEEEDNRVHYHAPEMISLYSMPSSSTGNMSATALLQKAAQIGSSTSNNNNNSTIFTSSSRQLFRQHMNDQLIANNDGMRDFLGTLGGEGARTDVGEDERRVILQEEMTYTMARSQDHHQEPYKDLMS